MSSKKDPVGQRPITVIVSLGISLGISLGVTSFSYSTGSLQYLERKFYDFVSHLLPSEPSKTNVVIVGLRENEIKTLGFPVTDEVLAELINKIDQQNPRVIGLDLHRNVNIGEKGNEELDEIFAQNQKLIGIEKTNRGDRNQDSIPAPIQLELAKRSGASEVIKDPDNIVRRAYLYTDHAELGQTKVRDVLSFGLALAYKYLEGSKIFPEASSQGWLKLNNAVFVPLDTADFFYSRHEIDNDQMLINYPDSEESFEKVGFLDVLEGNISSSLMTDKIVLIGATAETLGDTYLTPYPINMLRESNELNNVVYGVELHGIITHQIIGAALDEGKIISFPNPFFQYLWIAIWLVSIPVVSIQFCLIAPLNRQEIICLFIGVSSSVIVIVSGLAFFLAGWVMPIVTPLFFLVSYQFVTYILIRFDQISQEKIRLEEQVNEKTKALQLAQKKILEQEKFQVYELSYRRMAHDIVNKIGAIRSYQNHILFDLEEVRKFLQLHSSLFEDLGIMGESESESLIEPKIQLINSLKSREISRSIILSDEIQKIIKNIYYKKDRANLPKEAINIHKLLINIISEIIAAKKIQQNQLTLETNYEQNDCQIIGVVSEIEKALANIIDNAFSEVIKKFAHSGEKNQTVSGQPVVNITTKNQDNSVLIRIKDNGRGIKSEDLNQIFDSFWTTKAVGEGLGLGLYITKEIIEEHGGDITVDSEVGEGTEFTVVLPVEAQ